MAKTATLTLPANIIAGRPVVAMLTISNTDGTDVTVSSIQPIVTPSNAATPAPQSSAFSYSATVFPAGRTSTVSASGSLSVPLEMVFHAPQTKGNPLSTSGGPYLLDVITQTSDGTVFATSCPQWVSVGASPPQLSQGFGQFRFDDPRNAINLVAL